MDKNPSKENSMRQKAEELLKKKSSGNASPLSEVESSRLIYELQVHQIELELQNEELHHAWAEAEIANDKYIRLYDFAPSGYFTISKKGEIIELNLIGAKLLGKDRKHLKNSMFDLYISEETKPIFRIFLEKVFQTKSYETCEVKLVTDGDILMYVLLKGIITENQEQCNVNAVDITERKQTEREIAESRERYRGLSEASFEAIFFSEKGLCIEQNQAAEAMFGYTNEEATVRYGTEWIVPEFREMVMKKMMTGDEKPYEAVALRKDGTTFPCVLRGKMVHFKGRNVRVTSLTDITELKQAEQALVESESRLRVITDSAQDAILMMDPEGRIFYWNLAAERIFGYMKSEAIGKNLHTLLAPVQYHQAHNAAFPLFPQTGQGPAIGKTLELEAIRKDGKEIAVQLSLSSTNMNGCWYAVGIIRDMTERNRIEEEKSRQARLITLLLDSIPDIIFYKDTEGVYLGCNPSFDAFVGKHKNEIIGKTDYDLFDREIANFFRYHDVEMLKQRLPRHNEEWITYPDGKKTLIDTLKTPYWADDGSVLGILGISRDITDRKKAEEEIKHKNDELRQINAEKDRFFSIIAHDLRSPFNGFLGLTQLMAEELENLTSEEIKDFTLSMRNSAADMFRLLENLLEWARMQQGLITFNREIAQLAPIVDESIAIILEPAKIKGIEIILDISADITVFADRNILQTVIRNIVSNAVKFTPKGGRIRVSAKVTDYNNVEISIKDTGIGMSNKMIDDLFRLDVQTNRKGTEGEPSSGLGLLLCKDFIEKHGGRIWVESEEGKGSTFYFSLPAGR